MPKSVTTHPTYQNRTVAPASEDISSSAIALKILLAHRLRGTSHVVPQVTAPSCSLGLPTQVCFKDNNDNLMKEVVSSAAEAKTGGLVYNGKEACPIRTTLGELGFPQGPTPIQTDNSTACDITNDTVKQHRFKAMDMRYYWIRDRDRVLQNQFHIYWSRGSDNLTDYFTKHHLASHHRALRPFYLHTANALFSSCEGVLITSSGIQELCELERSSPISAKPPQQPKLASDEHPLSALN